MISWFVLLLDCAEAKPNYQPLSEQTWKFCDNSSFSMTINGTELPVIYDYCSWNNAIDLDFISKEIVQTTGAIFEFAAEYNLPQNECAYNYKLEIYNVEMSVLNNSKFMDHKTNAPLWGVYDPRVDETIVSSIILTDHGTAQNRLTLGHEMSHYWYDRMCWSGFWKIKDSDYSYNETFAQRFEKFYSKKNGVK